MNRYCVIRMDLMDSRKIEHRQKIQEFLLKYLNRLNSEYASILVAPITITLGDEWTIALRDGSYAYEIYLKIKQFLGENQIDAYAGVGFGTILEENCDLRKMNGTAFEQAKYSLLKAKSSKYGYRKEIPTKACHIVLSGFDLQFADQDWNAILNTLIQNNEILFSRVTRKQYDMICLYEKYQTYTKIIENEPNITKRMLSDCLNSAEYWLIKENVTLIQQILKLILKPQ